MGEFRDLDGQIGAAGFQLDVANYGPIFKNNGGDAQVRNAADSAFVPVEVGAPTLPGHAATRAYVDSLSKPLIVTAQFDGNDAIPTNTGTIGYMVVSTTGANGTIGEIYYDDGTSSGNQTLLATENGRQINTTTTLAGGTISFTADSTYQWDADGSSGGVQWVKTSDVGNITGTVRTISYAITNAAQQDSTAQLPAGATVVEARLTVGTAYSGGTTITIGTTGVANAFQGTADNKPTKGGTPNRFTKDQETAVGAASVVRTTIAGAPAAGAGTVTIFYSESDA